MKFITIIFLLIVVGKSFFGQNKNISEGNIFDGEPYIAVNPLNSQNMVVAWIGFIDSTRGHIKTRATFDAGQTWSDVNIIKHIFKVMVRQTLLWNLTIKEICF